MTFSQAAKTQSSGFFSFSGRASRAEYWRMAAPLLFLLVGALLFDLLVLGPVTYQELTTMTDFATGQQSQHLSTITSYGPRISSLVVALLVLIPFSAVLTRRVHDLGYPGWYAWVALFLAFFCGLVLSGLIGLIAQLAPIFAAILSVLIGLPQIILSILAFIVIMLWGTTPSEPGENEYGQEPTGEST